MRIRSWNVNGLGAVRGEGFGEWLTTTKPDVVALQEVRASDDHVAQELPKLPGLHAHFRAAEPKGYSGVGLLSQASRTRSRRAWVCRRSMPRGAFSSCGLGDWNIGWRIDMVLAPPRAMPYVHAAPIEAHVTGPDHCPVGVDVDEAIVA